MAPKVRVDELPDEPDDEALAIWDVPAFDGLPFVCAFGCAFDGAFDDAFDGALDLPCACDSAFAFASAAFASASASAASTFLASFARDAFTFASDNFKK